MTFYAILKELHAYNRYFILAALVFVLFRAYTGWLSNKRYEKPDNTSAAALLGLCHLQLLLGLLLLWVSPLGMAALSNGSALPGSWARYFTMEHAGAMFIAIVLVQVGRILPKRRPTTNKNIAPLRFMSPLLPCSSSVRWPTKVWY